jgi:flagellar biosynthesis/type III secretory pathway M-ring protein FliF/YscJ
MTASAQAAWTRLRDLYWGLPLAMRLCVATLLAVAVVWAGAMHFVPARLDMVFLMGGQEIKASQLQAICRTLDAEGLTVYQLEGSRIKVPREQVQQCTAAIAKHDVSVGGFYDPFDKAAEQSSWLSSGAQDDRRWELAKQKSLAQSIELMPEIESASVLIDRAASRGLRAAGEARATVTVKPRAGQELPPFRVRQIRTLVAGAVAGLAPENVAVVDLNGRTLLELGANGSGSDDLLMRIKEFEEHYSWKIRSVLSYLPDVMVTVNVELETTRQRRTEQVIPPQHEDTVASESHRAEPDSKPIVTANAATDLEPDETPPADPAPLQQTWEEHVALGPKSLTVSVSVPQDVVSASQSASHASESTDWAETIRQRVAGAIPAGVAASINVTSYPRASERLASGVASPRSRDAAAPWAIVLACVVVVSAAAAWMGLKWRQSRARRDRAAAPRGRQATRSGEEHRLVVRRSENNRELVRVERDNRDGRGPHIIQASIIGFEDLRWLAPASLQAVLGAVDSRLWAPALRGASRVLCDRILAHMPTRAAALLRDEIELTGPVRLGDVETAQQEILEIVRRLDHTGDLVLEDREEILHE